MKNSKFSITKKDFETQVFRCGGNGGQKVNKTSSGVRIIHKDSGARGECRNHRSQKQNKNEAFHRLTESNQFKIWLNRIIFNLDKIDKETEQKVDKAMEDKNLKIEIMIDGKWVEKVADTSENCSG